MLRLRHIRLLLDLLRHVLLVQLVMRHLVLVTSLLGPLLLHIVVHLLLLLGVLQPHRRRVYWLGLNQLMGLRGNVMRRAVRRLIRLGSRCKLGRSLRLLALLSLCARQLARPANLLWWLSVAALVQGEMV